MILFSENLLLAVVELRSRAFLDVHIRKPTFPHDFNCEIIVPFNLIKFRLSFCKDYLLKGIEMNMFYFLFAG